MGAEEKAKHIRLIVLDVDGVLTEGGLYYDSSGHIVKRFHVQDGLGIKLAASQGFEFAVITGLDSAAVRARVTELGITHYYPGYTQKMPLMLDLVFKTGISLEQMAYVGDDWVDAAPMSRVGLPIAVANAHPEVLSLAAWVTKAPGGHGAVREAIDFILRAQNKYASLWQEWLGA